jgi:hypothetical protein
MRYDLTLLSDFCAELGVTHRRKSESLLEIELVRDVVLCFQNEDGNDDCLVGFEGTPWHAHGDLVFVGHEGSYVEMNCIDAIQGLMDGKVLICDSLVDGTLVDRWLVHCVYNDEFKHLQPNEELRIRRAKVINPQGTKATPQ